MYEYPETDEKGIELTAKEMGINLVHIPFRKVSLSLFKGGYKLKSKNRNYNAILNELEVVLNRTQSKNRRLYAANVFEILDKQVINSSSIELLCFSKLRTLLEFWKNGIAMPKTLFIPCDSYDLRGNGSKIHNEEIIADLIDEDLGKKNIVLKPDAGTHGTMVKLARNRKELVKFLSETEPSIINPVGFIAQEMIDKWFYDLRIIIYKEKGKAPYCYPKGLARAGFKDFRTNTFLGNMVFGVNLPSIVRKKSIECGKAIGKKNKTWIIGLDGMPSISERIVDDEYVKFKLDKLNSSFEKINEIKRDNMKYRDFLSWNRKLEEAFKEYMRSEAYENIKDLIERSLNKERERIYFHEANACPDFWEQTRLIAGINVAVPLLKCARSICDHS